MANNMSVKRFGALSLLILSGSVLSGAKEARWDWALLTMVTSVSNATDFDLQSGEAEVALSGNKVAITFHDAKASKGLAPRTFNGLIDESGRIRGKLKGFDYDFEYEPMIGTYRNESTPDGCRAFEIALRDEFPRRRSMLISQEICPPTRKSADKEAGGD